MGCVKGGAGGRERGNKIGRGERKDRAFKLSQWHVSSNFLLNFKICLNLQHVPPQILIIWTGQKDLDLYLTDWVIHIDIEDHVE